MENFYKTIKFFIEKEAKTDKVLALAIETYKIKSYEECCKYILGEVSKANEQFYEDDQIFGLAKHYFLEEEVEIAKSRVANTLVAVKKEHSVRTKDISVPKSFNRKKTKKATPTRATKVIAENKESQLSLF